MNIKFMVGTVKFAAIISFCVMLSSLPAYGIATYSAYAWATYSITGYRDAAGTPLPGLPDGVSLSPFGDPAPRNRESSGGNAGSGFSGGELPGGAEAYATGWAAYDSFYPYDLNSAWSWGYFESGYMIDATSTITGFYIDYRLDYYIDVFTQVDYPYTENAWAYAYLWSFDGALNKSAGSSSTNRYDDAGFFLSSYFVEPGMGTFLTAGASAEGGAEASSPVPEPGTISLLGMGVLSFFGARKKLRRR